MAEEQNDDRLTNHVDSGSNLALSPTYKISNTEIKLPHASESNKKTQNIYQKKKKKTQKT